MFLRLIVYAFQYCLRSIEHKIDKDNDSAADYTILVKHLPKNMEGDLEQKIKDYFEKKTRELLPNEKRIEGEEVINRVNFIYDIDDLKECHDRQA